MFLCNFFRSLIFGISLGEILFLSSVTPVMANPKYNQDNIIPLMASSQESAPDLDEKSRLDQSLELISEMDDAELKVILFNELALNYAQLGDHEKAIAILDQSLAVAQNIEDVVLKVTAMLSVAEYYEQIGQKSQTIEIIENTVELVNMFEDVAVKVTTVLDIAQYYAQIGQKTQAIEILDNSVEIANNIPDKSLQGQLLLKISLKYGEMGEKEAAQAVFTQSQTIIAASELPVPEFPFTETPATFKLGFSGWVKSFRKTEALVGFDVDYYKQWSENDIFVDAIYFLDYDSSNSVNNYRPKILNFTFYRHHFNEQWSFVTNFFNSTNQFLFSSRDKDEDLTIISALYTGAGLNLWRGDTPSNFLDLQLAVGPRYQYDYIEFEQKRNQVDPTLAIILWGRGFSIGKAKIDETFAITPALNDFNNYDIISDTTLSIPLSQKWSFTNRLFLRYRNKEIFEGNPKWLFLFTTGLKYEF